MNRPALISVFSDQRRTKSTTRSRTSCGTHTLVRAPQDFFLRPCAQPSIRPAPHPSSGSSFPGTRSVVVRLGGPDGSWTGRQPPRSRRTLFANGRTRLAAAPVPHTDRKPALYPANAVLGCQPSLRQCSASALFACVLSVILTEERSLQFQLRQDIPSQRSHRPIFGSNQTSAAHASSPNQRNPAAHQDRIGVVNTMPLPPRSSPIIPIPRRYLTERGRGISVADAVSEASTCGLDRRSTTALAIFFSSRSAAFLAILRW